MDLPDLATRLQQRLEGLALPEGGWGYQAEGPAWVEPTALALLALAPAEPGPAVPLKGPGPLVAGLKFLLSCQHPDGWLRAHREDPDPGWATSPAILALAASGHGGNAELAAAWLESWRSPAELQSEEARIAIKELHAIDVRIPGWPWFGATSSWTEPTAMGCLALAAVRPDSPRLAGGLDFLVDRVGPRGGWNYGNPIALGTVLDVHPVPTAKAILALCRGGRSGDPAVTRSLPVLSGLVEGNPSRRARAWASLAFRAAGSTPEADREAEAAYDSGDGRGEGPAQPDAVALSLLAVRGRLGTLPWVLRRAAAAERTGDQGVGTPDRRLGPGGGDG